MTIEKLVDDILYVTSQQDQAREVVNAARAAHGMDSPQMNEALNILLPLNSKRAQLETELAKAVSVEYAHAIRSSPYQ